MSLFSFFRKNKQAAAAGADDGAFYSRAEPEPVNPRSRRRKQTEGGDAVDPILPEKKRARRRLIGAVALVLAAVIGLPMILDSEPKPLAEDIAIQIPSKDERVQKLRSASDTPATPSTPSASSVPVAKSLDPAEEVIDPSAEAASPKAGASNNELRPQTGRDASKPAAPVNSALPAVGKPDAQPDAKPETSAAKPATPDRPDDGARALAILEGKSVPKPGEKYVIQVAALASKDNVSELRARLKNAGIDSYTQTVATESGPRIRIRVGPFSSKQEAEHTRARILKLGLNGTLVPT